MSLSSNHHSPCDSGNSDDELSLKRRDKPRYEEEQVEEIDQDMSHDRHHKRSHSSKRSSRSPSAERKRYRHSRQSDSGSYRDDDRTTRSKQYFDNMDKRRHSQRGMMEPINPETLDHVVSYKQYCDYLRYTQPYKRFDEHSFRRRYDEYKEAFHAKQLASFFETNKDKQWFLEKYHPVLSEPRKQELKQRRLRYLDQFLEDMRHGLLDNVQLDEGIAYTINDSNKNKDDMDEGDEYENRLVIKTVLPTISRENILKLCEQVEGFDYLALSEPGPNRRFHRIGWINFKKGTNMQDAFDRLDKQVVDDFIFHLAMNRKNQVPLPRTPRLALEISNTEDRLKHDLEQAYNVAKAMDSFINVNGTKQVVERAKQVNKGNEHNTDGRSGIDDDNDDHDDSNSDHTVKKSSYIASLKKELDLLITYLRRVHMMCYYCGLECDSIEDLDRKCMEPHCRKAIDKDYQLDDSSAANAEKGGAAWAKNLDSKLSLKYEKPRNRALEKMGGKILDDEIEKFFNDNIQKEHSSKYRCKVDDCNKAFKGIDYVEKHIIARHATEMDKIKENTTFYNNYICDPNHLTPLVKNTNQNLAGNILNNSMMMVNGNMYMKMGMNQMNPVGGMLPSVAPYPFVVFQNRGTANQRHPPSSGMTNVSHSNPYNSKGSTTSTSLMDDMMPRDPRQVTSYVDLDAPAQGESSGPVFY